MNATRSPGLAFHGGRLDEASRRFPDAPGPWIDLSTGINPQAWGPATPPEVDLRRLPSDAALAGLNRAAARAFGAEALPVAALPGSEIGLRALAEAGLPRPWRVVAPAYRSHAAALPGATAISTAQLAEEAARGGTILLANPNNPDGRMVAPVDLLAVAHRLGGKGGVLVVDEAFVDAVPGASLVPHLAPADPVLVFRSFGKFFGLAGVRLGFAVGSAGLVAKQADRLGSWPVSATAIALGTSAYADAGWIDATRAGLAEAATTLDRLLAAHGLSARGDCPLFRLVETGQAADLFEALGRAGILVRPFDYAPTWLRFGLPGDAEALDRLDRALRHR